MAPRRASSAAAASPIPALAPVTTTTRPSRSVPPTPRRARSRPCGRRRRGRTSCRGCPRTLVPGRDPAVGIALGRVVDEPARCAHPELLRLGAASIGGSASLDCRRTAGEPRARAADEPTDPAAGGDRDPAAPRRQARRSRRSRCCSCSETTRRRFMPGVWVFPGGAVGDGTRGEQATRARRGSTTEPSTGLRRARARGGGRHRAVDGGRAAALVALDHARGGPDPLRHALLPGARAGRTRRRSRTARRPSTPAGSTPAAALERHRAGELELVFPTIKHLESLAPLRDRRARPSPRLADLPSSRSCRASSARATSSASCSPASPATSSRTSGR